MKANGNETLHQGDHIMGPEGRSTTDDATATKQTTQATASISPGAGMTASIILTVTVNEERTGLGRGTEGSITGRQIGPIIGRRDTGSTGKIHGPAVTIAGSCGFWVAGLVLCPARVKTRPHVKAYLV